MALEYHVAKYGSDSGDGTKSKPFLTINKAASIAVAGDTITVYEGEYREWVKPKNKGFSDKRRITYQAAKGERVVIKGSERIQTWVRIKSSVWKCTLPNEIFGDYNPYKEKVFGDWIVRADHKHLGDVYLNGMSFYEVDAYDDLFSPDIRYEILDDWTNKLTKVHNPEQTKYVWFVQVNDTDTTVYANFHGNNPNVELTEINVRRSCFYPKTTGIDYITVKGFEMAHAATPWTPPTADQPGLIGPNWSKGWIIEDNIIHDSKCSAISIGKEASTGNNYSSNRRDKPGYQYQLESVFLAEQAGWSKEKIGSHIIRNNTIYDCGQNGIVGHLGCVFSQIHKNHIYNIGLKREFYGHEIGGIKLHVAIDVQIFDNWIHDCSLGTWLDWQTQGTRVSRNLFYRNNRDLFIEVSHGPYIVDHNILASEYALDNFAQGGAYINNLICGKMVLREILNRSTPYHVPHSTKVAGFALVYGGDDRFFNNIFVGDKGLEGVGTLHYNGHTSSLQEYIEIVDEIDGDVEAFEKVKQPVYINKNAYLNGAEPFEGEDENLYDTDFDPHIQIIENEDEVYLACDLPSSFDDKKAKTHSTQTLGRVRIVDADFEKPDGSEVTLNTDYLGIQKTDNCLLGPIETLKSGKNYLKIWSK